MSSYFESFLIFCCMFIGNSSGITDASIKQLAMLENLQSISLSSFECITDSSLIHLVTKSKSLESISIRESDLITNQFMIELIKFAKSNPLRQFRVSLSETKINKPDKIPTNLKLIFEDNQRPKQSGDQEELSRIKMIAVVGMSAIILAMILITMFVVIVMPVGMLAKMLYDHLIDLAIASADGNGQPIQRSFVDVVYFYSTKFYNFISEKFYNLINNLVINK